MTVVAWLQENSTLFFEKEDNLSNSESKEEIDASSQTFTRYWIYSHHIYSNVSLNHILYDLYGLDIFHHFRQREETC